MSIFVKQDYQISLVRDSVDQTQRLGLIGIGIGAAMIISVSLLNPKDEGRDRVIALGLSVSGSIVSLISAFYISNSKDSAEYLEVHDALTSETVADQIKTDAEVNNATYQTMQARFGDLMNNAFDSTAKIDQLSQALSQVTSKLDQTQSVNDMLMYQLQKYEREAEKVKDKTLKREIGNNASYLNDAKEYQNSQQYLVDAIERGKLEQEALPDSSVEAQLGVSNSREQDDGDRFKLYDIRNHIKNEMTGFMIGGNPGSGKTSTVAEIIGILTEDNPAVVTICDHHANNIWYDHLGIVPITGVEAIYNTILACAKEIDKRRTRAALKQPLGVNRILIVDEFIPLKGHIKTRYGSEGVQLITDTLTNMALEGRKFDFMTGIICHSTNGGDAGMSAAMRDVGYTTINLNAIALKLIERDHGRDSDYYKAAKMMAYYGYTPNLGLYHHLTHSHHKQFVTKGNAPIFMAKPNILHEDVPLTYGKNNANDIVIDV